MFEIMSTLFLHTEMALQSTERTAIISGKGSEFSLTPGFVTMMNAICWEMAFDLLCKVLQLRDLHLWPPVSPAKKSSALFMGSHQYTPELQQRLKGPSRCRPVYSNCREPKQTPKYTPSLVCQGVEMQLGIFTTNLWIVPQNFDSCEHCNSGLSSNLSWQGCG